MASSETSDHSGGMPQLEFDTWAAQIFWTALALFLLYKVLSNKILPKIAGALEDRHNAIADDLDQASELKRKAEDAENAYNQALADAKANANAIVEATKADIAEKAAAENANAEAEISARTVEGEQRIGEIKAAAADSARTVASDAASAIVAKLAPGSADNSTIAAAVERALAQTGMAR